MMKKMRLALGFGVVLAVVLGVVLGLAWGLLSLLTERGVMDKADEKARSYERALRFKIAYFLSSALASGAGAASTAGVKSTHSKMALCEASPWRWPSLMMRV